MKLVFSTSLYMLAVATFIVSSCSKDASEPDVQFSANTTTINANEEVIFSVSGKADGFSIYTGDDGHKYENSYLVITKGKDIETENIYLTAARFQDLKSANIVSDAAILDSVQKMVGVKYKGLSHPTFLITLFYDYAVSAADVAKITAYFTVENSDQTPSGGFSIGVAMDASVKNKEYKYTYTKPGVYTATLLTANVGRKEFKSGKNPGLTTAEDYDRKYSTKTLTITVK